MKEEEMIKALEDKGYTVGKGERHYVLRSKAFRGGWIYSIREKLNPLKVYDYYAVFYPEVLDWKPKDDKKA